MKKLLLLVFATILCFNAYSQLEEKMKKYDVIEGSVTKDGKTIQGYIKKIDNPWRYQLEIKFIEKNKFEKTEKIRNKHFTKYKPRRCDGYTYGGTLKYVSAKYADIAKSELSLSMLPKWVFIQKIMDGRISFYYYFSIPKNIEDIKAEPFLLCKKEGNKTAKLVLTLSVKKMMKDCSKVAEKFAQDNYKAEEYSYGEKFGKDLVEREKTRVMAIMDYNKTCGK